MPAFKRLFVAICNFHSDHAGTHELVLREGTDGGMDSLLIETTSIRHVSQGRKARTTAIRPDNVQGRGYCPLFP